MIVVGCGSLVLLCLLGYSELERFIDEVDAPTHSINTGLVLANTRFGFKLLAEIHRQDDSENIFISPLSVSTALAMTYNGAAGETQQAMAKALELEEMTPQEVNSANAELRKSLENPDPKVELIIANSLWARQGVEFKTNFLQRNRQFFGAEIATLDFNDPQAPGIINQWVDTNTRGKVQKIVEDIDPRMVMFLINATYFKGIWQVEFDKSKTKEGIFHLPGGRGKQVPMMSQSGKYPYYWSESFQAVSLPYGGGRISLYLFLPDEGHSLIDFLRNLNQENWEQWMSLFRQMEGDITLPRFKLEYDEDLDGALKALGMEAAFDPDKANFGGMRSERDLFIQRVKHKAVVEVNEEGTEAAAVTSVEVGVTSVPEIFTIVVDRPFFFAIRDNQTGTVLFMGVVIEPK